MPNITNLQGETHHYETGCYVDGHWGNYGLSHMLERADEVLGTSFYEIADTLWHETAETIVFRNDDGTYSYQPAPLPAVSDVWDGFTFENLSEIANDAETALNDETPEGFVWHWHDSEFFLSPICDDETDCTDEMCAHWY